MCTFFLSSIRCLVEHGSGPWWCLPMGNRCKCDFPFVWKAFYQSFACSSWKCKGYALQAFLVFKLLSCWYPVTIYFPWIEFECGCKLCKCPRVKVYLKRVVFKRCAVLGSGSVYLWSSSRLQTVDDIRKLSPAHLRISSSQLPIWQMSRL